VRLLLSLLLTAGASAADRVPIGRVEGTGRPVYLNDKIAAGPSGRVRVILNDDTVVTIGPRGAVVVDAFVYKPDGDGTLAVRVLEGVFRFFSGKIAKKNPKNEKVELPFCSIGINGTDFGGSVERVALYSGAITVSNELGSIALTRPGDVAAAAKGRAPAMASAPPGLVQGRKRPPRGCSVLLSAGASGAEDFRACVKRKAEDGLPVVFDEIVAAAVILKDARFARAIKLAWALRQIREPKAVDPEEAPARAAYLHGVDADAAQALKAGYGLDAREGARLDAVFAPPAR